MPKPLYGYQAVSFWKANVHPLGGLVKKRTLRNTHRWIGLVAGFQLLAWTISGLYFTLIPIDEIRGSHLLETSELSAMKLGEGELISLSTLASIHIDIVDVAFSEVTLVDVLGEPVFIIDDHRYSAETGKELA